MDKKYRRAVNKISDDAQQAWDEGGTFYAPQFFVAMGQGMKMIVDHDDAPSHVVQRHVVWESALDAISAVGWRLNTWTVQAGVVGTHSTSCTWAFALFVRQHGG